MKIVHVINPVKVDERSDLSIAQPITFESMRVAKYFAQTINNDLHLELVTTQYSEDRAIIPDYFTVLSDMQRSVLDVSKFSVQRKLPLIKEILDKAYAIHEDADYLIYSNVDIALMPQFYLYVHDKIQNGYDSLIINRRTISNAFKLPAQLHRMYSEIGKQHPGYDCFVFKRDMYSKFILGNTCIGANWIGRVMYGNLSAFSKNLYVEKEGHLTFHVGDDGAWLSGKFNDFDIFNKTEAYRILNELKSVVADITKKEELANVVQFMDTWGTGAMKPQKKNLKTRLIQKIKTYLS